MTTAIFKLCDEFINRLAGLDPLTAVYWGLPGYAGQATDLSPTGHQARADLRAETLRRLDAMTPTDPADRLAAIHLRERLGTALAEHAIGEYQRDVLAGFGTLRSVRSAVELLPHETPDDWQLIAATLRSVPSTLATWRASIEEGVRSGRVAARRQALGMADQAAGYAVGAHLALVAEYGDGPLLAELDAAAEGAHQAYRSVATFLREKYAPLATEVDGVGEPRYQVAAGLRLGTRIDAREAYAWAWDELHRIEGEMAAEAAKVAGSVPAAVELLDRTDCVETAEQYQEWLQDRHDRAVTDLNGRHFDIDPAIRRVRTQLVPDGSAAYYVGPSEDLSRPGTTWWPTNGRTQFALWSDLTTVFHEGVPGHHLQIGQMRVSGDRLSRFARLVGVSGCLEGWALYAERLADELGWFDTPGRRLGMLLGAALRALRVVIDIGVHVGLPLPPDEAEQYGPQWTFDVVLRLLATRAYLPDHRVPGEAMRYFGWPAQASCYKLGERAWLDARAAARDRLGARFDLKAWHTAALELGPLGLDNLRAEL